MITSITGVVLAGGKSSRMGRNKALLSYREKPLVSYPLQILSSVFARVVLSINEPGTLQEFKYPEVPDSYPGVGPLGGILSVLQSGMGDIFCVACDMPFINATLVKRICEYRDYDAVIPLWNGSSEALHAFYSIRSIPYLHSSLRQGVYKIADAVRGANVLFLPEQQVAILDPDGRSFRNVNTPNDFEMLPPA